eukprot:767775-Hanusia_phi.AAC.3
MAERSSVLTYGGCYSDRTAQVRTDDLALGENRAGRIYILYTGQHYDALVGVKEEDNLPEAEVEKMLKCLGCSAILRDTEEFQKHCNEVQKKIVETGKELLIDEMAERYHIFYNTDSDPLSNYFLCEFSVDGKTYKSVEHYIQCVRYAPHVNLVNTIRNAKDAFEVLDIVAQTEFEEVSGWENACRLKVKRSLGEMSWDEH